MLKAIKEWCLAFWGQLKEFFDWIWESVVYFITEILFFIWDFFLDMVEGVITLIDFAQINSLATMQSWTGLPDQAIWLMNYINLPLMLSIVMGAYGIRLLINLLPSTVTRV